MIKAIIVDDEKNAVDSLKKDLQLYCSEIEIITTCSNVQDAYREISALKPQLVFLDIDLGKNTSFELLDLFDTIDFKIIFVTGHNDFAIKAIKYSALDYLLKPVNHLELIETIKKIQSTIPNQELYNHLKKQFKEKSLPSTIALNLGNSIEFIETKDILYAKAEGNFSQVVSSNQNEYFVSMPIKELESILEEKGFFRTHKSYLINTHHIKKLSLKENGMIILKNNVEIPLSQRKRQPFIKLMESVSNKF